MNPRRYAPATVPIATRRFGARINTSPSTNHPVDNLSAGSPDRICEPTAPAIKDPAKTHEITEHLARGRSDGMQTFDQHLLDLLRANKISVQTALDAATNRTDFQTKLELEGIFQAAPDEDEKPEVPFEIEPDGRF